MLSMTVPLGMLTSYTVPHSELLLCAAQTTTAAQPDSVLTFPSYWVSLAIMGLTIAIAWGGCALPVQPESRLAAIVNA